MQIERDGLFARLKKRVIQSIRPASDVSSSDLESSSWKAAGSECTQWAFRVLLDREPLDADLEKNATTLSLRELRERILTSTEFCAKNAHLLRPPWISGHEPAQVVDALVPEEALSPLFEHMQQVWEQLGRTEPHWSVLSREEYKQANVPDAQAFYATGQNELREVLATLDRVGLDPTFPKTCLEYGCGLGRITGWLATKFDHVHAVDISAPHLQLADEHFKELGVENITFHHLTSMDDLTRLPKVDLIYTVLVLQHNPPPVIVQMIRSMLRSLNPGGVAIFHVPTYRADYSFVLEEYLARNKGRTHFEMHGLPQKVIFQLIAEENAICLEARESHRGRQLDKPNMSTAFVVQKRNS